MRNPVQHTTSEGEQSALFYFKEIVFILIPQNFSTTNYTGIYSDLLFISS